LGQNKPKTVIIASAVGFYGDRADETLSETAGPGTGFLSEVCQAWEAAAADLDPTIRKVHVRIGVVLSSSGGMLEKVLPVFRSGGGGPLGSGKQWMSWVHLRDLLRIFFHILNHAEVSGPVNAVAPNPVTNADFTRVLAKKLQIPALFKAPEAVLKTALGERSQVLLESQRVSCEKLEKSGFEFEYPELSTALDDLLPTDGELFETHQWVPRPVDEVFAFFSSEKNLETITPPWLNFHVLGVSTPQIMSGTLIDYRLKLHGVPFKWKTRIEEWTPGKKFVDTQLKGPYKKWHHTHLFTPINGGTLISDRVIFKLPGGIVGNTVLRGWVRGDVEKIFQFRHRKIAELFS
jgi:ligand-binding SRPBCC domain-containing protein